MNKPGTDPPRLFRPRIDLWEARLYGEMLAGLGCRPLFELVMAIDPADAAIDAARATLASLAAQVYPDWRLSLVIRRSGGDFDELAGRLARGTDTVAALRGGILTRAGQHERLLFRLVQGIDAVADKVVLLPRGANRRLSELGCGKARVSEPVFVGLLAPGDVLSGDSLAELALQSGLHREADFLYSDEQRRNIASGRVEPFCKPDWSPDLILTTNYIGRLWCADAGLIERSGATLEELLRHGEYDLVLRLTEHARAIRHVREVLCRPGDSRPEPESSERQALARALVRRGIGAKIDAGRVPGTYRIKRRFADTPPVSIVMPTGGNVSLLRKSIASLLEKTDYQDFELIILHNESTSPEVFPYLETISGDKRITLIDSKGSFNFSRICNLGAAAARHRLLLFLNDDVEALDPAWLGTLVGEALRPEVGVVGPQLLYPDGTVQHAGMFLLDPLNGRHVFRHLGATSLAISGSP